LAALDLRGKRVSWEVPLGTTEDLLPLGVALKTGTPNFGGPIATAGGLVFIGAAMDRYLRAFDAHSGAELWRGRLPAPATATPMTYTWQGRQYVVVAAGGHGESGTAVSDAIVAFALPAEGEAVRGWWARTIDQPGGRFVAGASGSAALLFALLFAVLRARRRKRQWEVQRGTEQEARRR
ncbi:MAG: PQQ-binding-like beta-propeller repeat protein, partial [Propionivibrio sp.]